MLPLSIAEIETEIQRRAAEREATARATAAESQRQREAESKQAASAQREEIEKQWAEILARLADVVHRRNASIILGNLHRATPDEWDTLEREFTNVMREKMNLKGRYPYLKG